MGRKRDLALPGLRQWRSLLPLLVETRSFTRRVAELMSDGEYRDLQIELAVRPRAGAVIPGSGGVRKLRWAGGGKGKRGGLRLFYFWREASGRIYLLHLLEKSERADLTPRQLATLRRLVEEELP